MRISLVVAVARNGVIGSDGALPWHLPDDLKWFKAKTIGKPILMGRKTFQSIGRPLPGRTNIVLTRQSGVSLPGCVVVGSLADAIKAAGNAEELAVIGGAEIYALTLPSADAIYLTRVHADVSGETRFPTLIPDQWSERVVATHAADERHAHSFSFIELERVRAQ